MPEMFKFPSAETKKPEEGKEKEPETQPEQKERRENTEFDLKFYVTDHSADNPDTGNPEMLRELYADIKKDGVESVRYDWRWNKIEQARGEFSHEHLERYAQTKEVMGQVGLEAPSIILSSVPDWALKLYKEGNKEEFFGAFQKYAEQVETALETTGGEKVTHIQILNELNNKVFTPVATEDLPRLCQITREVFQDYNPDIKLTASILASNVNAKLKIGTEINKYLSDFEKIKDSFDTISIDYYPGLWHWPIKEAGILPKKEWFKQLGPLKSIFKKIADWGLEYELDEVGFPTGRFGDEKNKGIFMTCFPAPSNICFWNCAKKGQNYLSG